MNQQKKERKQREGSGRPVALPAEWLEEYIENLVDESVLEHRDDVEFKETIQNARRKLEVPMPAGMPCKTRGREYRETCSAPGVCKTKYACIVEADKSTRKRLEGTPHKGHEDHIAGKGINSLNHHNLVH